MEIVDRAVASDGSYREKIVRTNPRELSEMPATTVNNLFSPPALPSSNGSSGNGSPAALGAPSAKVRALLK